MGTAGPVSRCRGAAPRTRSSNLPPCWKRAALGPEDDAGCSPVGIELACGIGDSALRRGSAPAQIDDLALAAHLASLAGEGAHVIDLDLQGGISGASGQHRMHTAAHG